MVTIHIRTTKKFYIGIIIFCYLFLIHYTTNNYTTTLDALSSKTGIVGLLVILYCFYKMFFGKGKIILSETEFKLRYKNWTSWEEFVSVYPFTEEDSENGPKSFIYFRLKDGFDISVRSENLEMSFEEIAELVYKYKKNYENSKH